MDTKFREQQWNTFICNPRAWAPQYCGLGQRWLAKRLLGDFLRRGSLLTTTPMRPHSLGKQVPCQSAQSFRRPVRCNPYVT
jgi:hypothetical protein